MHAAVVNVTQLVNKGSLYTVEGWATQDRAQALLHHRLDETEETMEQIPEQLRESEHRRSDLQDRSFSYDKNMNVLQKKLLASKIKMDKMENYAQRSNLLFVGIPEGAERIEGRDNPRLYMETMIKEHLLEQAPGDLTIMTAIKC
ncbi:hypothetical protein NDU88_000467 [Pleurodeles waltl]|uniref:Uncharacterized protein n=1 Tax=Pleurodeles waltl TaxID=8319 RepID=A0AAV7VWL5_PLEWA|nr:hypothetical protein NDU88_000467 [Pleurodeles waltl]